MARILLVKTGHPIDDKTVKKLWQQSPVSCQGHLGLWDYHRHPDRYQARLQVIQLYYHGWEKGSISRFLHVSQPTVNAWIRRFEAEHFAGLVDKSRAPQTPVRKIWLPLMVQVYHLFVGRSARRGSLRARLQKANVETWVHSPVPVHKQKAFAGKGRSLLVAEKFASQILSLPLYPQLSRADVVRIAVLVRKHS